MPKTDPRKAASTEAAKASKPQALDTASAVQSEVVANSAARQRRECRRLRHWPTNCRIRQPAGVQCLPERFQRGCRESRQPFLTAAPTAISLEAAAGSRLLGRASFDEYGTARSLPTIRVTLSPTVWQKSTTL